MSLLQSILKFDTPNKPMGLVWATMGMACMIAPRFFVNLSFAPDRNPSDNQDTVDLLMRCFGSQAVCCGIAIAATNWNKDMYSLWAKVVAPYFVFDALAYSKGYLTELGAIGDAVGNLIFMYCCGKGAGWF